MPGIAHSLILIGLCSGFVSASGHISSYSGGWCGVPGCRAVTLRGADGEVTYTSVTVDDKSSLLDCSGCRMLMSGSASEGRWRHPQYCKTKVGAYNTVRALSCLEGLKAPIPSYPDSTFPQACRVWSSVLRLTRVSCLTLRSSL